MAESSETTESRSLWQVWEAHGARLAWQQSLAQSGNSEVIDRALAELPEVSAVEALEVNRLLVEQLTAHRWYVMQAAREEGSSWSEIGAALGMSKQGAHDWYRKTIATREQVVPDFHDAKRARAAL